MRIVAGRYRGRRLAAPPGFDVRPTGERTREALFDVLSRGRDGAQALTGLRVLDAFAGSGALGLEALSRGAVQVSFMESQAVALAVLRDNVRHLEAEAACQVFKADVLRPPKASEPVDLVLMDPPYNQGMAEPGLRALVSAGWIAPGTRVIVELMAKEPFDPPDGFTVTDQRKYGKARLVFLSTDQDGAGQDHEGGAEAT
ncbi:MAG: 16S rRNA (guanine(966)-N(2))-methyltransferase RsmD [Pseudomonadota bacterium]